MLGRLLLMFSPRARGCSLGISCFHIGIAVFPACAGMFPCVSPPCDQGARFPRVRGDVPTIASNAAKIGKFSPRARGCSHLYERLVSYTAVFPACAGMFRCRTGCGCVRHGFPRVRGDVPLENIEPDTKSEFSPRARGCSSPSTWPCRWCRVFPACAGMFRAPRKSAPPPPRFPRVRGDVPVQFAANLMLVLFSPRARGCSGIRLRDKNPQEVFPACAGMFLSRSSP